ncbi:MAG: long-chain fatty acid--CoA ligase [bacterium]|nr:long-chain fatty acid--CoA ligase [bacterium]
MNTSLKTKEDIKKEIKETSVAVVFQNRVEQYGDRACTGYNKNNAWYNFSWNEMDSMIRKTANYLLSINIKKGDRVAVCSQTRYEWWVADLALLSIGAISVPVHATNSPEESLYVLDHSAAKVCFTGNNEDLKNILAVRDKLPGLKRIISFDSQNEAAKGVLSLEDAMNSGESYENTEEFDERLRDLDPEDSATYMYTSGTTGNPKAVILTHNNFLSNVNQVYHDIEAYISDEDIFLSFMPLSHVLERTCGYYFPMKMGSTVYFARDVTTVLEDMQAVRPTCIISVPRIYEKIHATILARVSEASIIKRAIFGFAVKTGTKNVPYICTEKKRTGLFALRYGIADRLVFSKLKKAMGFDRLRFTISGAGPLSVSDANFFLGMDLKIMEGYGLTEASPVITCNRPWLIKPGAVGEAVHGTIVRISEEGEVQAKGPQVMKGYYKDPEATAEAFTPDGFLKTGDIGIIDGDNFLAITGRIKDIIVTAGGKNISPQNIENSIKGSRFIEQIAIIGDKRKFLSALVIPAFEELGRWAKNNGIEFGDNKDLVANRGIKELIEKEITKYTVQFSRLEQIRRFTLLDAEWTQATGELTASLKVKRRVIEKYYGDKIEAMYTVV